MSNGQADFNSQKVIFKPRYQTTLKVSIKDVKASEITEKLETSKIGDFELKEESESSCVILFKSKDDSNRAMKILKSIVGEVESSHDMEIYNKIHEEVRKNPIKIVKKPKATNPLPFMHLGADTEAVQPEKKHRQSVMHPPSNQALREELNEDIQARQRIYSEQVLDPSESSQVGY